MDFLFHYFVVFFVHFLHILFEYFLFKYFAVYRLLLSAPLSAAPGSSAAFSLLRNDRSRAFFLIELAASFGAYQAFPVVANQVVSAGQL